MSRPFFTTRLEPSTVQDVVSLLPVIDFVPVYQRQSEIWSAAKRQLFIDSLINGYDIPKLYFHDLSWRPAKADLSWKPKQRKKRYAIIDGKQRLEAIEAFVKGVIPLPTDFEDIERPEGSSEARRASGMTYSELSSKHPDIKARFDRADLPVVLVQTEDREFIEEMFSRLNEAVPLNAPEKRNALGGPLPKQIRRLAETEFFVDRLAFPNSRYRHLDLATKFLYIEYKRNLVDLKKRDLDGFVKLFKAKNLVQKSQELYARCTLILSTMTPVFSEEDPLLTSVGMITIYFQLFRAAFEEQWLQKVGRQSLVNFETERARNRLRVREYQELTLEGHKASAAEINPVLVAFERWVQSPNDVTALRQRYRILRHFVVEGSLPVMDPTELEQP